MGTFYFIANFTDKTLFDLGKYIGSEFILEPELLLYRESIEETIENLLDGSSNYINQYQIWQNIIDSIWNFVKSANPNDLQCFSDSGDELYIFKSFGYKFIGTRYDLEDMIKYNENLNRLNSHLNCSPHLYQKSEAVKYIDSTEINQKKL